MVKFENLVSATVKVYSPDVNDDWNITAEVIINTGTIDRINQGEVRKNDENNTLVASFSTSGEQYLNLSYFQFDKAAAELVLKAIIGFVDEVKAQNVNELVAL